MVRSGGRNGVREEKHKLGTDLHRRKVHIVLNYDGNTRSVMR